MDLFEATHSSHGHEKSPLAERLRPKNANDILGLPHGSGVWRSIHRALKGQSLPPNLILWGPPGTGKTSLARLLSTTCDAYFQALNAVDTGAKEMKAIGEECRSRKLTGRQSILFIDEIHRLNKAQQDVLLPYTERGDFILIGATTENPSYEMNSALLSRCQVARIERLSNLALESLLTKALHEFKISLLDLLTPPSIQLLIRASDGDGRRLLTLVETILSAWQQRGTPIEPPELEELLSGVVWGYQKTGDDHYDLISAFIKSVRGSDPDAAVYYLARMLAGGESPIFIARRLVILASEDIGNADPRGLQVAISGLQAVELVGLPECAISLAQVTTYLASAPKSNASYQALRKAEASVRETARLEVPLSLRSSQTSLAKRLGYGRDYLYSHDDPRGYVPQQFLPEALVDKKFYEPKEIGFEKNIRQFLAWLKQER